ncbi:beta-galactosidase [Sarracenia purpurea var. burkii]
MKENLSNLTSGNKAETGSIFPHQQYVAPIRTPPIARKKRNLPGNPDPDAEVTATGIGIFGCTEAQAENKQRGEKEGCETEGCSVTPHSDLRQPAEPNSATRYEFRTIHNPDLESYPG